MSLDNLDTDEPWRVLEMADLSQGKKKKAKKTGGAETADEASEPSKPSSTDIDYDYDFGDDVSALLEPGKDFGVEQTRELLERQRDFYEAPITWKTMIFTLFISFVDVAMIVVELIFNGGFSKSAWVNVEIPALLVLGGKSTPLIQQGQVWRLVSAMYLHVGILHLVMNLATQILIGVQLERGLGFFRMAFIYTMSGIGGNLLSALFLPRILEVGASSSLFGLFGIYFVDLLVNWRLHLNRRRKLLILLVSTILSLVLGVLPMIDNFAHIGGFFVGILSAMLVIPKLTIPPSTLRRRRMRQCMIVTRVLLAIAILALYLGGGLALLYFKVNVEKACPFCEYISCLPVFDDCQRMLNPGNSTTP